MPRRKDISARQLAERLAGTRLPDDPTDVVLPYESPRWPADLQQHLSDGLTPAGVLIPVMQRTTRLTVLLTERSAELKHHAGQISFPGGRMEATDENIAATALRETHEEVGIAPAQVTVLGYLDPMPTVTGYAVTPTIGVVASPTQLRLDPREVSSAFEVPLDFLLDHSNERSGERTFQGRTIAVAEFHYERHRIWGATAHILIQLRKKLLEQ